MRNFMITFGGVVVFAMSVACHTPCEVAKVGEIDGFDIPECCLVSPDGRTVYVSNISTDSEGYWVDDQKGFISTFDKNGKIKNLKWKDSAPGKVIHAPKGMAILDDHLYFTDNTRLKRVRIADDGSAGELEVMPEPVGVKINDLASDGKRLYITDGEQSKVWRMSGDGKLSPVKAPFGVNGVTPFGDQLFAVSWKEHDLFELDPEGRDDPVPFGLAKHFSNLDGIEVLDDGSFIVTDWTGNKIAHVTADRKTVTTLHEMRSPADLGIDREANLIYVPEFLGTKCHVFKLVRDR